MDDKQTTIARAYDYHRAIDYFNNIDTQFILDWYKELDYLTALLTSMKVLHPYSQHEILLDFEVVTGLGDIKYIQVDGQRSRAIDEVAIMNEIFKMFINEK